MKINNLKKISMFIGVIFLINSLNSCKMIFDKFTGGKTDEKSSKNQEVLLDSINWSKTSMDIKVGSMDYIVLNGKPENKRSDAIIAYQYDSNIIKLTSDSRGAIVEGLKQGKTTLTAQNGNLTATCIVNVSGYDENYQKEPYIYSSSNIIQLKPGAQERIAVSLYGGSAEDSQRFNWTTEKPSVAEIAANGQFCLIKAVGEGNSKITVTHPKAAYPFSLLVYSLPDTQNATFITTNENVVSLQKDKGEKSISVNMQNPPEGFSPSLYKWELVKKEGEEICSIDSNADKAVITPLNAGTCLLKVSHPAASYPLEILVRITEIVKNVYIEPSETFVEISGDKTKNVTVKLKGYADNYNVNDFSWEIEKNEVIDTVHFGNEISISGKKTGIAKITVNHPLAAYPRDIMVKVVNQTSDAIDASMYITTSQNYIRTKVGADTIPLNILLYGGETGDQKKFIWDIKQNPKTQGKDVIKFETTHGDILSRAVSSYEEGLGYITPLNEGSSIIQISHPKILYPTEVLVKVLPSYSVLDSPLYFTGEALVKLLNKSEKEIKINLLGQTKKESDNDAISWKTDSQNIQITGAGEKCLIKAIGTGSNISFINTTHPNVESAKKITVLTADTQDELDKIKVLYAYKNSYKVKAEQSQIVFAETAGFSEDEIKNLTWHSQSPDILKCENYTSSEGEHIYTACKINGIKAGEAKLVLKSNISGVQDLVFNITVLPKNANLEVEPDEAYLTTFQNVVSLKTKNSSEKVEVTAVGLSLIKQNEIKWEVENDEIVAVTPNANKAIFSAKKEGETKVFVSHPDCQNKLTIYVRVGNEFIFKPDNTIYIATNTDTLLMLKDEKPSKLTAQLVTGSGSLLQQSNFSFKIDKNDIANINSSDNGTCIISPKKAGQAMITVTHPKAAFSKNVILIIGNSKEELEGIKYLTTAHNVINITKGQSKNISVTVMNAKETIVSGFEWQSERPDIANINPSGATAVLTGNEVGTTKIKVSNTECPYPLELIVVCIDPVYTANNPYISTPSNVLTLKADRLSSAWTTLIATLEGGSNFDQQNFSWQIENSSLVQMFGQGNSCKMRAISTGTTRLIITHPKAEHPCYVLLICDEVVKSKCHISVPENIITMKPNDGERAITANLINGDIEDKYAFNWYADTYDIIELNYSANVASIKPIGQGQTTIHITHPKAAYEQQIIVKVTEYTQFEFGMEYFKIVKGKTSFINMRVPITAVPCHVEYESLNPQICMIEGTSKVAQITALKEGNTKVKARLVATKTNAVQAETEMLVNIEPAPADLVYISTQNTIHTIEKGTTKTLTATITGEGISVIDGQNLKWKSSDPSTVKLTAASNTGTATGTQCMLQALKAGECTVTVSHEKANTDLILKIIVPGTDEIDISLNKTYIKLETGGRSEIKAKLINAKPEDYKTIEWSIEKQNEVTIAEILGKGETIAVFARNTGKTVLHARLPNGKFAECEIIVEASRNITFATQQVIIEPGQTKEVKYSVAPDDVSINWVADSNDYFDYVINSDLKIISITGKKSGHARLTGVTQYGNRASLIVKCSWDYNFTIDKTIIQSEPDIDSSNADKFIINYTVNPSDANIRVELKTDNNSFVSWTCDSEKKQIILNPISEGKGELEITAINDRDNNKIIGVRKVALNLFYKKVNFSTTITEKDGNFSGYEVSKNQLILGDGEKIGFKLKPNKEKVNIEPVRVELDKNLINAGVEITEIGGVYYLSHPKDYVEEVYKLHSKLKTFYKDKKKGTRIEVSDMIRTEASVAVRIDAFYIGEAYTLLDKNKNLIGVYYASLFENVYSPFLTRGVQIKPADSLLNYLDYEFIPCEPYELPVEKYKTLNCYFPPCKMTHKEGQSYIVDLPELDYGKDGFKRQQKPSSDKSVQKSITGVINIFYKQGVSRETKRIQLAVKFETRKCSKNQD